MGSTISMKLHLQLAKAPFADGSFGVLQPLGGVAGERGGGCSHRSLLASPGPVSVAPTHYSLEFLAFSALRYLQDFPIYTMELLLFSLSLH